MYRQLCARMRLMQCLGLIVACAIVVGCPRSAAPPEADIPQPTDEDVPAPEPEATPAQTLEYATLGEALEAAKRPRSWEMVVATADGDEVGRQLVMYRQDKPWRAILGEGDMRIYMLYDRDVQVRYTPSDHSFTASLHISLDELGTIPPADAGLYDPESVIIDAEQVDGVDCWIVEGVVGRRNPPVVLSVEKATGLVTHMATFNGDLTVGNRRIGQLGKGDFELPESVDLPPPDTLGR